MDQQEKSQIFQALGQRGVRLPCPRCGNQSFTLVDGYFNEMVQPNSNTLNIGGPTIPSIITACNRCGYLSQHALGTLGLLSQPSKNKQNGKNEK